MKLFANPFIRFLLLFGGLCVLWFTFYHHIYKIDQLYTSNPEVNGIQKNISILLAKFSNLFLSVFGYQPELHTDTHYVITKITGTYVNHGVWIGEPCNGIKVFGLFAIFIIAFKGKWYDKIWFIELGFYIITTVNAIRIALLTIMAAEYPESLQFNHNITFQVVVYGVVFLLWMWWVRKFAGIENKANA